MTSPTLDQLIREMADRGQITHISLVPSQTGKKWRGSFTPASYAGGISFAEDADPVKALIMALDIAKLRKRKPIDVPLIDQPIVDIKQEEDISDIL